MDMLGWTAAAATLFAAAVIAIAAAWIARRPKAPSPLPVDWALSSRPVFSADERRVFKLLREALPHHVVLSKLPLVRFSQPSDPEEVRYWYELLGAIHVTFAVCSANGRVLAAIDLDTDRGNSRRVLQIKQSVLGACRIRYLRCPVDNLPSAAELQLLVPSSTAAAARGPLPAAPATNLDEARDSLASTVASRRAQRSALWQDSSVFQDSFFAPDSRGDSGGQGEYGGYATNGHAEPAREPAVRRNDGGEVAGVVVEAEARTPASSHH